MELLLAFSPFLAFLVAQHLLGIVPALCAGAAVAVALIVRERLRGARETRVLEGGTALLFGGLAACTAFVPGVAWSVGLVRLVVDCGLMLVVFAGIALGKPFTLPYARAQVTAERAATPAFMKVVDQVAAAWGAAFGVLALADLVLILQPTWPLAIPIGISAAALLGAVKLTQWLPTRGKAR